MVHSVRGQEGIAQNVVRLLPDAVHAAGSLNQADNGPRQVVIHDDGAVLKVLPFAQDVGGDEDAEFGAVRHEIVFFVALRTEAPRQLRRVCRVAAHGLHPRHAARRKLFLQIAHRVGELGKDENFAVRVRTCEQVFQCAEFHVLCRLPLTEPDQQVPERFGIGHEVFVQVFREVVRGQPAEPPLVCAGNERVGRRGTGTEVFFGFQRVGPFGLFVFFTFFIVRFLEDVTACAFRVFIEIMRVQEPRVRWSDGERQIVLDGVEKDEVPEDVPLHRKQERVTAAFESLEEIGSAEPLESLAGA